MMTLFVATASGQFPAPAKPPQLRIEAPPELEYLRTRFESSNPDRFAGVLELVGLNAPGPAIRVVLVPEGSDMARDVAPWIAGFFRSGTDAVVMFPARTPAYPHNSLEDVLRHEVAHVLIERAAGGRQVPRWFNEGLAMAAERSRSFEDETRSLYQFVVGPAASLAELERLFSAGQDSQPILDRAYALSAAFVRDLIQEHGQAAPGRLLQRMRNGAPFDRAFTVITGQTPGEAESRFWQRQRIWTTWVPIITSSAAVWALVTIIALVAIRRRRQKDAVMRRKWDEEESDDPDQWLDY